MGKFFLSWEFYTYRKNVFNRKRFLIWMLSIQNKGQDIYKSCFQTDKKPMSSVDGLFKSVWFCLHICKSALSYRLLTTPPPPTLQFRVSHFQKYKCSPNFLHWFKLSSVVMAHDVVHINKLHTEIKLKKLLTSIYI